jgi:hypothetical protein
MKNCTPSLVDVLVNLSTILLLRGHTDAVLPFECTFENRVCNTEHAHDHLANFCIVPFYVELFEVTLDIDVLLALEGLINKPEIRVEIELLVLTPSHCDMEVLVVFILLHDRSDVLDWRFDLIP